METTPVTDRSKTAYVRQVFAGPMANCLYVLGDPATMRCYVVDPAFEPLELVRIAESDGYQVDAVLATHVHPDHVGGHIMGFDIPGVRELLAQRELPVLIHELEAGRLIEQTGIPERLVRSYAEGDELSLGELTMPVLHTPGHSPGSSCIHAGDDLISGDTLFVQGCGRIDLPGSDPDAMFSSLQRLAALPETTRIYPGHNYGPSPSSTIGDEKRLNPYLRVATIEQWRTMMGAF